MSEKAINDMGLNECCKVTIRAYAGPEEHGTIITCPSCKYHGGKTGPPNSMILLDGVWTWNNPTWAGFRHEKKEGA